MKRENFYRRDPGAALAGMAGMSLEERGVYNTIIDLLYLTWRPVEDNRAYIAGHCGCAVQKLNPLIAKLLAAGKLVRFEEGAQAYISNPKFEDERASVKGVTTRSGRGEVGEKSPGVEEKSASVGQNPPTCGDKPSENQPVTPLEKSRVDESRVISADDKARARFEDWDGQSLASLESQLREAAGASLNISAPKLLIVAPILALLKPGGGPPCDFGLDVLPAIRAAAQKVPRPGYVNRWDYFVPMIAEARDGRLRGAPAMGDVVPLRATGPPNWAAEQAAVIAEARRRVLEEPDTRHG